MTLAQLPRDEPASIVRVDGGGALAQRLMALGFLPGSRVRIVQVAPFGDPIAVEVDGWRVGLRRREAALVLVERAG